MTCPLPPNLTLYDTLHSQVTLPRGGGQTQGRGGRGGRGAVSLNLPRSHPPTPHTDTTYVATTPHLVPTSNFDLSDTSGWRSDPDSEEYDDQAVEIFEGGKGADHEHEWHDDTSGDGSRPTVLAEDTDSLSVNTIGSDASSDPSHASSLPPGPLLWSPDPAATPLQSPTPLYQSITPYTSSTEKPSSTRLTGLAAINASRASMVANLAGYPTTDDTPALLAITSDEEAPAPSLDEPQSPDEPSGLSGWKTVSSTNTQS
jgi:hypothetical protein